MPDDSANRTRYHQRMQRVVDHINANLDDTLDLDTLAEVACLSRFHWHRVYRGLTGETIHATVRRLKLNRATQQLKSGTSLQQIAQNAGYTSETAFGRAFKAQLGHSPAAFRASPYTAPRPALLKLESFATRLQTENLEVNIQQRPAQRLAVVRHVGPYNGNPAFATLIKAAKAQGLPAGPLFGFSFDDPALVAAKDLRSMVGIEVSLNTALSPPLEMHETPATRYAVFNYRGPNERLGMVFDWIFGAWLPASGEVPANLPALSIHLDNPETTAAEDLRTDICIPLLERA